MFSANKLAYFLQRSGENLRLEFKKYHYGPYSPQIAHVLYALNGTYIYGLEQKESKPFEPLMLNYEKFQEVQNYIVKELSDEHRQRLENSVKLIEGFQSELSLEILASVDVIVAENPGSTFDTVFEAVRWTDRKKKLFKRTYVNIAFQHLQDYRNLTNQVAATYN